MKALSRQTTTRQMNPYVFDCVVNGEVLAGRIVGTESYPYHYMFVVEFSNGEKIRFYSVEDGWTVEQGYESYLPQVGPEMDKFFFGTFILNRCL